VCILSDVGALSRLATRNITAPSCKVLIRIGIEKPKRDNINNRLKLLHLIGIRYGWMDGLMNGWMDVA